MRASTQPMRPSGLGRGQRATRALPADQNTSTQRERLLAAIVHVSCEHGYEDATIALVISHAGVSRATFYEHFSDKEDCFLAALQDVQRNVLAASDRSIAEQPPQHAGAAALAALVSFAQEHPAKARLLMNETMAAGPRALDARDRGVEEIAGLIERAYRNASQDTAVPALPGQIITGAAYRLLASRLRRGERDLGALLEGLLGWLSAYGEPGAQRWWRTVRPMPTSARAPLLARAPLRAPPALAPGRPRYSTPAVAENQRLRIIFATAEIVRRDGYADARVAAITAAAGVDRRVFYRLFAGKRDAFAAVHELAFQNVMAVTAGAFFTAEGWPRRIWEAGRAFTQYLEQDPALAHAALVESHAGSPGIVQRFEELQAGFTIFLQEGYQHRPLRPGGPPSRIALEAVAQADAELLYRQARARTAPELVALTAHLVYVCLAPFVGAARAGELIEEMQRDSEGGHP